MSPESLRHFGLLVLLAALLAGCGKEAEQGLSTTSPEALQSYREGVSQLEKFYYTEAKSSFERALQQDSAFAMAWLRLAMVQLSSEGEIKARESAAHALALASHASQHEQLFIRMWEAYLRFDNATAARIADSLLTLYPKDREAYLFRGRLYESAKDLESAIQMYKKAVSIDTSYAMGAMTLGYAYSAIGKQDLALQEMARYIRLAPDAADPRASYADLLLRVGRYKEALDQYRKSLSLKPDFWYAFRQIGEIMLVSGQLKAAEENYLKSVDALPPSPRQSALRLEFLARVNMQRGSYEEAAKQYRTALQADTTNPSPAFGYLLALSKLRRFSEAHEMLQVIWREFEKRGLTTTPSMVSFYLVKARLYTEEQRADSALQACYDALGFSAAYGRAPISRQQAEIYLQQKAYDNALDACSDALSVNPNYPDALLTILRVYHATGDRNMTLEIGERLLDFWKDADPDFLSLKEVRRLLGSSQPRT